MTWDFTVSFDSHTKLKHELGNSMTVLKVAAVCDGSAGTLTMKTTKLDPGNSYNEYMDEITGSWLYLVKMIPSTTAAPDNTYDLDFEDEKGSHILDTDANPYTVDTTDAFIVGSDTLGVFPLIRDHLALVFADLGTDQDATDVYMYFLK